MMQEQVLGSWEITMKNVLLYLCLPHLAGSEGVLITAAIGTKMSNPGYCGPSVLQVHIAGSC